MSATDVGALLDRVAILDFLARYCDLLDAYDIDGVAATFTNDARRNYGPCRGGSVPGRTAIRDRIAAIQAAFRRTHHQLGHSTLNITGDTAVGVTAAIAWHERRSGSKELLALRYIDEFSRVDGEWLIAYRRVEVSLVEGFEISGTGGNAVHQTLDHRRLDLAARPPSADQIDHQVPTTP